MGGRKWKSLGSSFGPQLGASLTLPLAEPQLPPPELGAGGGRGGSPALAEMGKLRLQVHCKGLAPSAAWGSCPVPPTRFSQVPLLRLSLGISRSISSSSSSGCLCLCSLPFHDFPRSSHLSVFPSVSRLSPHQPACLPLPVILTLPLPVSFSPSDCLDASFLVCLTSRLSISLSFLSQSPRLPGSL